MPTMAGSVSALGAKSMAPVRPTPARARPGQRPHSNMQPRSSLEAAGRYVEFDLSSIVSLPPVDVSIPPRVAQGVQNLALEHSICETHFESPPAVEATAEPERVPEPERQTETVEEEASVPQSASTSASDLGEVPVEGAAPLLIAGYDESSPAPLSPVVVGEPDRERDVAVSVSPSPSPVSAPVLIQAPITIQPPIEAVPPPGAMGSPIFRTVGDDAPTPVVAPSPYTPEPEVEAAPVQAPAPERDLQTSIAEAKESFPTCAVTLGQLESMGLLTDVQRLDTAIALLLDGKDLGSVVNALFST
ncbi:hypothetical protein KIPB_006464 [Kipferlia bialata]|uniref:Uncharacterized protein n=1 Tax=Kipferlia bialata TaxID=797122 RepID=A0A9K3GI69_9EUKA|nr:hypothetical protein KIPB_006464 [Kipferlia bialata]|eukprot:g6464.t1